jgi:hypothetical protein
MAYDLKHRTTTWSTITPATVILLAQPSRVARPPGVVGLATGVLNPPA